MASEYDVKSGVPSLWGATFELPERASSLVGAQLQIKHDPNTVATAIALRRDVM